MTVVDKNELRKRMRQVRAEVDDRLFRSVDLWRQVAEMPGYRAASTVMAFKGFKGEPDTDPLFARLAAEGKRLLLPRVNDGAIEVCDADGPMLASRIGVEEPQGPALPYDIVDFVIVPGLAFTPNGARLGYGGGFYDRTLAALQPKPFTVGLGYTNGFLPELMPEPHDVPLDAVLNDNGVVWPIS